MWINCFSCRQQWTVASSPTQVCICSVMTNYATWIDRPFFTVNYQFARRRGNIQIFIFTLHSSHLASSRRNTRSKTLVLFFTNEENIAISNFEYKSVQGMQTILLTAVVSKNFLLYIILNPVFLQIILSCLTECKWS